MDAITLMGHSSLLTAKSRSFKCLFTYGGSTKFDIFGPWLCEVNALEIKILTEI